MDPPKHNALDAAFCLMREWSVSLLYTSHAGLEPCRCERIKKKRIMHLMGNLIFVWYFKISRC